MNFTMEYYLLKYEELSVLSDTKKCRTSLMRNKDTGEIVVKKEMGKESFSVYSLLKSIKNKNLIKVLECFRDEDKTIEIEEYVNGKRLDDYFREKKATLEQVVDVGIALCEGLAPMHKLNLVHRDIQPKNIIITNEGSLKIIDFDISRKENENATHDTTLLGTVGYAAPEQYNGDGSVRSDIYSIGILLLYMASSGHVQSFTSEAESVCRLYSNSIGPVIRKCIRHNSIQRYKSIAALRKELCSISDTMNYKKIAKFDITKKFLGFFRGKKSVIADKNNTDKVCHIYVYGFMHNSGATHFCLCFASFLKRKKRNVICIRHNDTSDYRAVTDKGTLCNGIYTIGADKIKGKAGIDIIPDYNGCITYNLSGYEYIIHDCGCIDEHCNSRRGECAEGGKDGITIFVGNTNYRRNNMTAMENVTSDSIIFINHIGGREFYDFISSYKGKCRIYRFPCIYEWDSANELFEEEADEIMEIIEK